MIPNSPRRRSFRRSAAPLVFRGVAAVLALASSSAFAWDDKPAEPAPKAETTTESADHEEETPARVFKTDAEWRRLLTPSQYMVTRMKATEPPFSGKYSHGRFKGTFHCVCCGATLFDARHKFESGTGWPSFWRPITVRALTQSLDRSEPELRVEVNCAHCGAHIGHVFQDGPPPTGLRYCTNSLSLKLEPEPSRAARPAIPHSETTPKTPQAEAPARRVHRRGGRY